MEATSDRAAHRDRRRLAQPVITHCAAVGDSFVKAVSGDRTSERVICRYLGIHARFHRDQHDHRARADGTTDPAPPALVDQHTNRRTPVTSLDPACELRGDRHSGGVARPFRAVRCAGGEVRRAMGRIRKLAARTLSPGGSMHGLVRPESSAEQAAREHSDLLREQNRLLQGLGPSPVPPCPGCSRVTVCGHKKTCPQYTERRPTRIFQQSRPGSGARARSRIRCCGRASRATRRQSSATVPSTCRAAESTRRYIAIQMADRGYVKPGSMTSVGPSADSGSSDRHHREIANCPAISAPSASSNV